MGCDAIKFGIILLFYFEDGNSTFALNVGEFLPDYTASHLRTHLSHVLRFEDPTGDPQWNDFMEIGNALLYTYIA